MAKEIDEYRERIYYIREKREEETEGKTRTRAQLLEKKGKKDVRGSKKGVCSRE